MINFSGRLIADKNTYSKLKYTSGKEIENAIRPFVEAEDFIVDDDVYIKASGYAKGDKITIKYNDIESEVASSYGGIEAIDVLLEILKIACIKKDIKFKSAKPKDITNAIKNYYKNKF